MKNEREFRPNLILKFFWGCFEEGGNISGEIAGIERVLVFEAFEVKEGFWRNRERGICREGLCCCWCF